MYRRRKLINSVLLGQSQNLIPKLKKRIKRKNGVGKGGSERNLVPVVVTAVEGKFFLHLIP